jgi:hypothetical protein
VRAAGGSGVFGSYEEDGAVRGAVMLTPPYELLLTVVPDHAITPLATTLRSAGIDLPGVNGAVDLARRFAEAWTAGTGLDRVVGRRERLHRLRGLTPPDPAPPGRARAAGPDDAELAAEWVGAFAAEAGAHTRDAAGLVRERMARGRVLLWEDAAGRPVSLAARTATIAGVTRIGPVYTPPGQRGRGHAAAVTAACAADALAAGARDVVLFTDLANPTSNGVYRRIGFEGVSDRVIIRFRA